MSQEKWELTKKHYCQCNLLKIYIDIRIFSSYADFHTNTLLILCTKLLVCTHIFVHGCGSLFAITCTCSGTCTKVQMCNCYWFPTFTHPHGTHMVCDVGVGAAKKSPHTKILLFSLYGNPTSVVTLSDTFAKSCMTSHQLFLPLHTYWSNEVNYTPFL